MSVDQFRESIRERYGDVTSLEYEAVRWNAGGFISLGMLLNDAFYCAPRKSKGVTRQAWRLAVVAAQQDRWNCSGSTYPRPTWGAH